MDFLSAIIGAFLGSAGTVIAAIVATRSAKTKTASPIVQLSEDVLRQAKELTPLKRQLLLALRKYEEGRRIEPVGDRNAQRLAGYSILTAEKLTTRIDMDSGITVVTLTNRGWKVAAAIDALEEGVER